MLQHHALVIDVETHLVAQPVQRQSLVAGGLRNCGESQAEVKKRQILQYPVIGCDREMLGLREQLTITRRLLQDRFADLRSIARVPAVSAPEPGKHIHAISNGVRSEEHTSELQSHV